MAVLAEALGVPIDAFISDPPPAVISRRQDGYGDHASSAALDRAVIRAADDVRFLLSRGIIEPTDSAPRPVPTTYEQAEQLAGDIRSRLSPEFDPIDSLGDLAECLGVIWFVENLGGASDGPCIELSDDDRFRTGVAVIDGTQDPGRRRWSLAHELGHFVVGDAYASDQRAGDIEQMIDAFVAYLLMPRAGCQRLWNDHSDEGARRVALAISARFGTSWTAACSHLRNIGLITKTQLEPLKNDRPTRGDYLVSGESWAPDLEPPGVPTRYTSAVLGAFQKGLIATERTLELLRGTVERLDLPKRHPVASGSYMALPDP